MKGKTSVVFTPHVPPPIRESQVRHVLRKTHYRFLEVLALRVRQLPRRLHCYNISVGKSGSHSVHGMFARHYRAAHEPYAQIALDEADGYRCGFKSAADKREFLVRRDRALCLEMEASPFLIWDVKDLVELFPEAKFIVTLRDCYSWLNSMINFSLKERSTERQTRLRAALFGESEFTFAPEEEALRRCGLFTLDGYLSYWATQNQNALDRIPPGRRIVIRTRELASSTLRLADFLDIPVTTLDAKQAHRFRTGVDYHMLEQIDRSFLEQKIASHCRALMSEYFPETRNMDDAWIDKAKTEC